MNQTQQSLLSGPDFVVKEVSGPVAVWPGQSIRTKVTVCNQGTVGDSTNVDLFLSSDKSISPTDPLAGGLLLGWMAAGQCITEELYLTPSVPDGAWYLGAIADTYNSSAESNEANNARAGTLMGIGIGPDFIIKEVTAPTSIRPGDEFSSTVTVCNQGTQGGSVEAQLVLSQDTDIRFVHGAPPDQQDMPLRSLSAGWLNPGQCYTEQLFTSASPPSEGVWYLGAVADPGQLEVELIEANNTRASAAVGIGHLPDFIIKEITGPVSIRPGDPLTVKVTVCNQGTVFGGTDVELVLSQDTTLRSAYGDPSPDQDLPLGGFYLGGLEPGQCFTESVHTSAYPPSEGAWYLGALADSGNAQPELIETNNTRASTVVGIGHRPDFIIKAITGPVSIRPGEPFTVSATVCNQGTQFGGTDVLLVLSQDTTLRFSNDGPPEQQDLLLTSFHSGGLEPGQCFTQQEQVYAHPSPEGAWYLGAMADAPNYEPELIETNNTRASRAVGIGHGPDFIIKELSAPPSLRGGDPFTASVTVCNQGTEPGSTDVELVLSQDATIRFSYDGPQGDQDQPLTSFHSGPLLPGGCATHPVQSYVYPPYEGAWYLGAVADPGHSEYELIETNNSRASVAIGIGHRADFVVKELNVPASIAPGGPFHGSVTVCNQGTTPGYAEVQLVLSQDTDIHFSYNGSPSEQDIPVQFAYLGTLQPGQCATQPMDGSVYPPQEGPWYLGAVVDPGNSEQELLETNNTLASKLVGIGHQPDYVIQEVMTPASVRPAEPFPTTVTVCNQGTTSGSTEVTLFLSRDTSIRSGPDDAANQQDPEVQNFHSGLLHPGQCETRELQVSIDPQQEGAWYLGATANFWRYESELISTNNTLASKVLGVGYRPDFTIKSVTGPASIRPGDTFFTTVTVCNQGTEFGGTHVQVMLSKDTTIRYETDSPSEDVPLESFDSGPLEPGQCSTQQVPGYVYPDMEGPWYLGAVADPYNYEQELLETNNTRASTVVGIGHRPDFIIKEIVTPPSVRPGDLFTPSVTVCNQGTVYSGTDVQLVLTKDTSIHFSNDGTPEDQDQHLEFFHSGPLEPGQCATQQLNLSVYPPEDGPWYLGAVADPGSAEQELIETNNTRFSAVVGMGHRSDIIVKAITGPASVRPGDPLTLSLTLCNQGTTPGIGEAMVVLSKDTDIRFSAGQFPGDDLPLEMFASMLLEPGRCATQQLNLSVYPPEEGPWYLGAVADPNNYEQELIETNNTRASAAIGIGNRADYIIKEVSGPASVRPGDPFTVHFTICNQGTAPGSTNVQLVLSQDTTIRFSIGSPYGDLPLEMISSDELQPGQCAKRQVETSAYPQQEGPWYLGAVADPLNYAYELIETNNTRASAAIGIGYRADYIIKEVTGPASIRPGDAATVSFTVCNQGTQAGYTSVQLVLSQDSTIRFSFQGNPSENDLPVDIFSSDLLEPGQCTKLQQTVSVYAPQEGLWYLGAVADAWNDEQELIETNNTRASKVVGIGYRADFIVKEVLVPASALPGEPFTTTVTVCNQGTSGGHAEVQLVLSEDTDIRFSNHGTPDYQDEPVGFLSVGPLEPGQCSSKPVSTSVYPYFEGAWYLGAVVDPGQYELELNETNNALASKPFGVGHRADFIVKELTGPANLRMGDPFGLSVTVCNQGTRDGQAEVQLVFSEDTDIRFFYSDPLESQDWPVEFLSLGYMRPGQCITRTLTAQGYPPQEGTWYLGAVVDPGQYEQELMETNNTRASKAISIRY